MRCSTKKMIIKIRITTPKGQASKAQRKLQPLLIGSKKRLKKFNTYVNEDDNEMYWEIESDVKKCLKISKNVAGYKGMIEMVLKNKTHGRDVAKNQDWCPFKISGSILREMGRYVAGCFI